MSKASLRSACIVGALFCAVLGSKQAFARMNPPISSPTVVAQAAQSRHAGVVTVVVNLGKNTLSVLDAEGEIYVDDNGFEWENIPVVTGVATRRLRGQTFTVHVSDFVYNPEWNLPGVGYAAPDDPNNPLGDYWITVSGSIGMHHTNPAGLAVFNRPASQRTVSHGCIRVKEMRRLFKLLQAGDRIRIE